MESLGKFPDAFAAEIAGQPHALRRAAAGLAEQRDLLDAIAARRTPRVVLSGMGSSYDAAYPAVGALAARGILAVHVDAAELLAFRADALGPGTTLILTSQSGLSGEVVALAERVAAAPDPPFLVAVTNGLENPLAGLARVALDTRAGEEHGPSTMTFAASMLVLAAVGDVVGGDDVAAAIALARERARAAAGAIEYVLVDARAVAGRVAEVLRGRSVVILGRGPARAAAEMGALTLKESGVNAESFEGAAFRHGPFELAGPDLAAIAIATEPETREADRAMVEDLRAAGAGVVVIAPDEHGDVRVPSVDRTILPAVSIVPIQLAAHRLARELGREPGVYLRASKVTTRA